MCCAKSLQSCLFATLWNIACQVPLSMGLSRQEYWSGLPWPPPGDLPDPGIEPTSFMSSALSGEVFITSTWETHITVSMQYLVTQSRPTLWDPMDCSPPGPWEFSRQEYWNGLPCSLFQGMFPTQGLKPGLPHCRQILYHLNHHGSPRILEWVAYPFSRGSSWIRNQPGVSCTAGRFFTSWTTREALYMATINPQIDSVASSFLVGVPFNFFLLNCSARISGMLWKRSGKSTLPCS